MSELKKLLGKRIKEIRISRKLTQEDLSELTDIGTSSISKIEGGYFHPTDENMERIANALNVKPYKLYMFNHQRSRQEIIDELQTILNHSNDEQLKIIYKVINSIID